MLYRYSTPEPSTWHIFHSICHSYRTFYSCGSNFQQWLKPVQHDSALGSQSVPPLSSEALHEMSVAQVEEFSKLAQHLLTANLPNADYEAILLCHKQDMEAQQEKIVDEAGRDGNVDA